jgi:hypothetical protein
MNSTTPQSKEISVELNEKIAQGIYSNLAIISHSDSEFVVDFVSMLPGVPKAPVVSRIILTPEHAKRLMQALNDNISKYESTHGNINAAHGSINIPMNFGGNTAQA